MDCPSCDKEIKAEVVADIIEEHGFGKKPVEIVALYLTCEHCKTELYTSVRTSKFETI